MSVASSTVALLCLAALQAAGCARDTSSTQALTVFAASSLQDAFAELARDFGRAHPDIRVQLSFAGSQVLRMQIEQGATADVFASADPDHMNALRSAGLVRAGRLLARGGLSVIVPLDNPAAIQRFEQLPAASRIVIGGAQVPLGIYTRRMLERARVQLGAPFADAVQRNVVSEENNARLVRAKVELGEADAAIVYRSDAAASSRLRAVAVPESLDVQARYEIAALAAAARPDAARAFIEHALSSAGAAVLTRHGLEAGDVRTSDSAARNADRARP